jgi:hypothetical protein
MSIGPAQYLTIFLNERFTNCCMYSILLQKQAKMSSPFHFPDPDFVFVFPGAEASASGYR